MYTVEEGIPANERTYRKITSAWPRSSRIQISIQGAPQALRIPLEFVRNSGDDSWHIVHRMLSLLLNESGQLVTVDGRPLVLDARAEAGEYLFIPLDGNVTFSWRQGPTGLRKGQAITEDESEQDSSISACSYDQTRFRESVIARDAFCLVTDQESLLQAVHIVPKQRLDVYARVLDDVDVEAHERSMGLLLSLDMQATYNAWDWSLYYKSGSYFVHVFMPGSDHSLAKYHGKEISPSRFHQILPTSSYPDPRLCNWHWEQCVLMHVRGFSSGMAVNAM